jgi:hypothetical protein
MNDEISFDDVSSDNKENEEAWNSNISEFTDIKMVDNMNPALKQSYFKIKINEIVDLIHKQSAYWLLSQ